MFSGDIDNDHPDDNFRGHGPEMHFIASGPEVFCWDALGTWTSTHPFARDCTAEVLRRDPTVVIRAADLTPPEQPEKSS
jgi:hypothetical protein